MEPILNYPFIKHLHENLGIFIYSLYIVNVTDEIQNNMLTRCSHFLSDSSAFWSKKSPIFSTFWVISTHGTIFIEVNNSDKGCAFYKMRYQVEWLIDEKCLYGDKNQIRGGFIETHIKLIYYFFEYSNVPVIFPSLRRWCIHVYF